MIPFEIQRNMTQVDAMIDELNDEVEADAVLEVTDAPPPGRTPPPPPVLSRSSPPQRPSVVPPSLPPLGPPPLPVV
ncbi:MAG TPA: hypothetical protein VJT73_16610, partial [Polyangiaceae bacterium]|nr:hypothetical protein [Polyangiaceae bacterium]